MKEGVMGIDPEVKQQSVVENQNCGLPGCLPTSDLPTAHPPPCGHRALGHAIYHFMYNDRIASLLPHNEFQRHSSCLPVEPQHPTPLHIKYLMSW